MASFIHYLDPTNRKQRSPVCGQATRRDLLTRDTEKVTCAGCLHAIAVRLAEQQGEQPPAHTPSDATGDV